MVASNNRRLTVDAFSMVGVILVSGFALFMFCIGLALVGWVVGRVEMDKRKADALEQERRHQERLRALELGFPLPEAELARAQADASRARWAGAVGFLVPLGLSGLALAATVIVLDHLPGDTFSMMHLPPVLYAIWGISGLVSLMAVLMSATALRRGKQPSAEARVPRPRAEERPLAQVNR